MVHTRGLGKIGLVEIFVNEDLEKKNFRQTIINNLINQKRDEISDLKEKQTEKISELKEKQDEQVMTIFLKLQHFSGF